MKKIKFDITKRPKTDAEHVAYLVDNSNVKLMRQYIEKQCPQSASGYFWIPWFDDVIGNKIKQDSTNKYYLYFKKEQVLGWDNIDDSVAKAYHYEIYHVVPQPTVIEIE